jgi:hypothetical protein
MTQPVYSTNFVSEILTDTENAATVPHGFVWVVRQITMTNLTGSDGDSAFVRESAITYLATALWSSGVTPPPPYSFSVEGRWVLEQDEELQWVANVGTWTFHIDGYVLTLP